MGCLPKNFRPFLFCLSDELQDGVLVRIINVAHCLDMSTLLWLGIASFLGHIFLPPSHKAWEQGKAKLGHAICVYN